MARKDIGSPSFRLISASGDAIDLYPGRDYILGRALSADARVIDGTVSAEHASLRVTGDGVSIKDLGSVNGCLLNGERITEGLARENDSLGFGRVRFKLARVEAKPAPAGEAAEPRDGARSAPAAPAAAAPPVAGGAPGASAGARAGQQPASSAPKPAAPPSAGDLATAGGLTMVRVPADLLLDPRAAKLTLLLEVSKDLSRPLDTEELLERVCDRMLTLTNVDRVAIVEVEGEALDLKTRIAATRRGRDASFAMPRSLAYTAIAEMKPLRVDRGQGDARIREESLVARGIYSTMCVPLQDERGGLLGLLYVDSSVPGRSFSDDDLDFLQSFGGLVTSALRSSELVQALRREASALERVRARLGPNLGDEFFAEGLALRSGEVRPVVVVEARLVGAERAGTDADTDLAAALGEFFGALAEVVFDYGGMVDRLQANRIVGGWGVTYAREDDPDRAYAAARDMLRTWGGESGSPRFGLGVGVGMSSGKARIHSAQVDGRAWLTVVGEPATEATRLCLRAGAGEILMTSALYDSLAKRPAASRLTFSRPAAFRVKHAHG